MYRYLLQFHAKYTKLIFYNSSYANILKLKGNKGKKIDLVDLPTIAPKAPYLPASVA